MQNGKCPQSVGWHARRDSNSRPSDSKFRPFGFRSYAAQAHKQTLAVLLVVTDPPDPLADIAREASAESRVNARVISAGTFLDSMRFRVHLGRHFGVDPAHVEAQVVGDHGTSQVFLWSSARIGGVPLAALLRKRGET